MNTTFKTQNFFDNNSPKLIQIIGDIGLVASFVSTNILIWKQEIISLGFTSLEHNPIFDKINAWALAIGVTVKLISKFFGMDFGTATNFPDDDPDEIKDNELKTK